jgi:hypothetical protein
MVCDRRHGCADDGRNRVHNVPLERSGRDCGSFATWEVINVPRRPANASGGALSTSPPRPRRSVVDMCCAPSRGSRPVRASAAAPGESELSDEQWRENCERFVAEMGFAGEQATAQRGWRPSSAAVRPAARIAREQSARSRGRLSCQPTRQRRGEPMSRASGLALMMLGAGRRISGVITNVPAIDCWVCVRLFSCGVWGR